MDKNGLLEILALHRTGKDLDEAVEKDKDYQEALVQQQKVFDMIDEIDLTADQKRVVNEAITANNHTGTVYGAVAYRLGMTDGIKLRMEMEAIMNPTQ